MIVAHATILRTPTDLDASRCEPGGIVPGLASGGRPVSWCASAPPAGGWLVIVPRAIYAPLVLRSHRSIRAPLLGLALVALIGAVAIPALAASPAPSAGAAPTEKPGKGPKASHQPEIPITIRGVVGTTIDADGDTAYTLTANGKTLTLEAGPSWFYGKKHPLAPSVGKTVTITGSQSGDEIDVETVDGVRIRAEGKPPWAGGWKAVGSAHPGWSQEKADRWAQHLKDKAAKGDRPDKAESPEAGESPEPSGS